MTYLERARLEYSAAGYLQYGTVYAPVIIDHYYNTIMYSLKSMLYSKCRTSVFLNSSDVTMIYKKLNAFDVHIEVADMALSLFVKIHSTANDFINGVCSDEVFRHLKFCSAVALVILDDCTNYVNGGK